MREMLFFPLIWVKLFLVTTGLADFDDVALSVFLPPALAEMSVCAVMHVS